MFLFLFLGWLGVAMPKMGIRMHSTATLVKLPTPWNRLGTLVSYGCKADCTVVLMHARQELGS